MNTHARMAWIRIFEKGAVCRLFKKVQRETREKSASEGVLSEYVGASRSTATKRMGLFQQPAKED
jgi:hypothetical protein